MFQIFGSSSIIETKKQRGERRKKETPAKVQFQTVVFSFGNRVRLEKLTTRFLLIFYWHLLNIDLLMH